MNALATAIWFIIILSIVIIGHEFGHFIVARVNGIKVNEFDVGMGPTLFHFTKNGTKFCLKLLPLGGACIFEGTEIDPESIKLGDKSSEELEDIEENKKEEELRSVDVSGNKSFREANVWSRIATVLAGPFFNFIIGMIFAVIIVGFCGSDLPIITGLTEGRPAIESGLQIGDEITKINKEKVHIWRDISLISIVNSGEPLTIEYIRDGVKNTAVVTPAYSEEDDRYYIGIEGGNQYIECKGLNLFKYSFYEMEFSFKNTLKALLQLVRGKIKKENVSGPVGIAQTVNESYTVSKKYGLSSVVLTMMSLTMMLSVNLGIINLLPLPAIDGGRLVFLLVEVVRGKPVPPEKEGLVHLIGIVIFFLLAIFIVINDISKIVG